MNIDKAYMQRCLELAQKAKEEGESAVGSIVVMNEQIIGEAYEKSRQLKDITRHAETLAILDALQHTNSLEQATIYSNVEPCALCSHIIRHHKIKRVVFLHHCGELGGTAPLFDVLINDQVRSWSRPPEVVVLESM